VTGRFQLGEDAVEEFELSAGPVQVVPATQTAKMLFEQNQMRSLPLTHGHVHELLD